jgi:hypothetical protein
VGDDQGMGTIIAMLGVVAAGFSAWAARKSALAAEAANRASGGMAVIEAARRHQELTPVLAVRIKPLNPGDIRTFKLFVGIDGPIALRRVASLAVGIRDDRPGRATEGMSFGGDQASKDQLAAQIWGPLRLTPHLLAGGGQVDEDGRAIVMPNGLAVGESVQLQLEQVQPPPWTGCDRASAWKWWRSVVATTVRLAVELKDVSGDAWLIPLEIDVPELVPIGDSFR